MKKTYGKPVITFESFALSSNIAGSCSSTIEGAVTGTTPCENYGTHSDPVTGSCVYHDGEFVVFYSDCDMGPQDGVFGNLCYHTGSEEYRMFAS